MIQSSLNSFENLIQILVGNRLRISESLIDGRVLPAEYERRVDVLRRHESRLQDSPQVVLWTTGTGGQSRGVCLTREALWQNARAKLAAVPQSVTDVRLTVLPVCHAYARTCDIGTWLLSGGTLALGLGGKDLKPLIDCVEPTMMNLVPSLAQTLLDGLSEGGDFPGGLARLSTLGVGGAALDSNAFDAWRDRGVTVIQGYGLTETGPTVCSATAEDSRAGLVGRPVLGWQTKIVDRQLWVRGASLMSGYLDVPDHQTFDRDGWFATGDLVEQTEDGQFRILGRADDRLVLANGFNVDPMPIENEVNSIAGVRHSLLRLNDSGTLELWIDGDSDRERAIRRRLAGHRSLGTFQVRYFDSPLDVHSGELTSKGTICRRRILDRRWGSA